MDPAPSQTRYAVTASALLVQTYFGRTVQHSIVQIPITGRKASQKDAPKREL